MRLSFFTLENILLFEANLALYARIVGAVTLTANGSSCGGCTVTVGPKTLTFPNNNVAEVTRSVTATVVPYVFQYDNGTEVTSLSTFSAAGGGAQTVYTAPSALTWSTYGTVLTYPTTYLAFVSPLAGISKSQTGANAFCYASLTTVALKASDYAKLIYPAAAVAAEHDIITAAVSSYLDTLPSVTAAVAPYKPAECSHFVGPPQTSSGIVSIPVASSSDSRTIEASLEPVTHTSVAFLLQTGKPIITRIGAAGMNQGGGSSSGGGGSSPGGGTTTGNTPGGTPASAPPPPTAKPTPVLNIGGSTITAGTNGAFNVGGQNLTPGGAVVVSSTTYVLATDGTVAVVNGATSTLSSATSRTPELSNEGMSRVGLSGLAIGVIGLVAVAL
ncbi:hypothetical protein EJ08DRAFT_395341 [Tothia fuscella]|uniref:Uncharacterized protein n=1 Tax=Tothia fuscella TaxID=1048955 RepID=A0A9P4TVQ1_9PEZI|nr:hypothetical protein EJ08DRAFT_395341 [Tothia fuscella]